MKAVLIIAVVVLGAGPAAAQEINGRDVPDAVVKAFTGKYAGAKAEKWEKEGGNYEAEFDWNKTKSSAAFDASGKFMQYEQDIKTAELPAAASAYCTINFKDYKISEASKITDASGKVMYEAELSKGRDEMDLIFDDDGNFIRKETGAEENDDDKK